MRIFVLGASGGIGKHVVQRARAAGHTVTAMSRTPDLVASDGLEVLAGDATQPQPLGDAVAGHDAVVITIGGSLSDRDTRHRATANVVAAMKANGVQRVVAISSLGAGDSYGRVGFATKAITKTLLRNAIKDHNAQEQVLTASGLDWTILRPAGLTNDDTEVRVIADATSPLKGNGRVGRDAVAGVVMDALEGPKWSRAAVAILAP
jgi:uncharacterized protein YbjT (DUF2867 family)